MTAEARKRVEKLIAEEEYEEALALLTQLNIQDPALEALLLIKSEEFEKALSKGIIGFEAAYCQYRLGDYEKAIKELPSSNEKRSLILKGQIYYKLGNYGEALKMYSQALPEMHEEERKNVLVNFYACKAAMAWSAQMGNQMKADDDSNAFLEDCGAYEIMYNRGIELMAQDKEDAALLFKAASGMQQRDGDQVDPAVQYNLDLCLGNSSSVKEAVSIINSAIKRESLNKAVKVLKKELNKLKLPVFQKQIAVEQLIVRAVDEKKYHTAYNLSKLIDDHQLIQSHLNLAIKKCRSLKNFQVNEPIQLTLIDLEKFI